MSLITEILSIASEVSPTSTVILSSKFNSNVQGFLTAEANLPLIILDNELSKISEIKKNNNVQKDTKVLITILRLDSQDNTDSQSNTICESMEDIADLIAVRIYQIVAVRPIGNQKYKITPLYRVFGSMMTGVAMEMQVNYNTIVNFE